MKSLQSIWKLMLKTLQNSKKIVNAGSMYNGKYTPMSLSDYTVGTNHVLPTAGSAKFSSGLNINEFIKKISIVTLSKLGVKNCKSRYNSFGV